MPVGVKAAVATVREVAQVGAQIVGEKDAVAPVGSPAAEKETYTLSLHAALPILESMRVWPEISSNSQLAIGLAATAAVTVKVKLVVWVTPPPVPVTVIV